jgi:hypothetical protein
MTHCILLKFYPTKDDDRKGKKDALFPIAAHQFSCLFSPVLQGTTLSPGGEEIAAAQIWPDPV